MPSTKKKTLAVEESFVDSLRRFRTFREWLTTEHAESLSDISEHGADSGYHGMIYRTDINALLAEFESEIEGIVEDVGPINEGFDAYCKRNHSSFTVQGLKDWLVWSAAELIAHEVGGES